MKWHCGLLSDRPDKDRTLQWLKRGMWDRGLPEDVEHELRVWMAMPGFSAGYHASAFNVDVRTVLKHIGGYDGLKREVGENWLSATRDDCVKLSRLRQKGGAIPVICQLSMLDDLKRGMKRVEIYRDYAVDEGATRKLWKGGVTFRGELPIGFSLLWAPKFV